MKLLLILVAIAPTVVTKPAMAACKIWAVENTSAGIQDRQRIFAWSDLTTMEELVAEAAGIAERKAEAYNLDFVDVFLTREKDGTDRSFHMASTTTVWMRYNPGRTPVIDTRWTADALVDGATEDMSEYGMFLGERVDLDEAEISKIVEEKPAGVSESCAS